MKPECISCEYHLLQAAICPHVAESFTVNRITHDSPSMSFVAEHTLH